MTAHHRGDSLSRVRLHLDDEEDSASPIAAASAGAGAYVTVALESPSSAVAPLPVPLAGARKRLVSMQSSAMSSEVEDEEAAIVVEEATPHVHLPSPMPDCSFLSRITWSWLDPFLALGAAKVLVEDDMHQLMPKEQAQLNLEGLQAACKRVEDEQKAQFAAEAAANPDQPPKRTRLNLWKALAYQFGPHYLKVQCLLFLYTGFKIVQPLMLDQLVQFVSDPEEADWHGYLYAIALGLGALGQALTHHNYFFHAYRVGIDVRIALNGLIYSKALKLRTTHMMKTTTGQVVNLVSNDSSKSEDLCIYLPYLWNGAMECGIVLALLYQQIGVAAFAGFGAILCLVPMQLTFSHLFSHYRTYTVKRTDLRVKTINEILTGADVLKMMGWEKSLEEKVNAVRNEEFQSINNAARLKSINQAAFFASASVVNLVCFLTMWGRNVPFTPANVFTSISLFNVVKMSLTNFIPLAVERLSESFIAVQRITTFLELDDAVANDQAKHSEQLAAVEKNNAELRERTSGVPTGSVTMEQASFVWEILSEEPTKSVPPGATSDASEPTSPTDAPSVASEGIPATFDSRQGLRTLDVSIQPGQLVGVIGSIGHGKSSFLAACLGEMTQMNGGSFVNGTVSYASQTAWIFAGTIRENILFGRPFDAQRYMRTIRACQLVEDIKACSAGDQTQIGEKGVNLSGGQRARLSCARAVYSDADVYLFDDPLAALDAIVARRLFESVMSAGGMLAGKTRILVTHQTHLLTQAHILLLEHGRIASQGSFDQLVAQGHLKEEQRHQQQDNDSALEEAQKKHRKKAARDQRRKQKEDRLNNPEAASPVAKVNQVDTNSINRAETSSVGDLDLMVFVKLFRAGGGVHYAFATIGLIVLGQASSIIADKWLANWSGKSVADQRDGTNAWVYIGIVAATIILGVIRARAFFIFILRAASKLHETMFHSVVYSPMRFFESNPIGRVLNRFAKDQSTVDELLPLTSFDFTQCFWMVIGSLVVIGMSAPYVLLVLIPVIPLFVWVRRRFLATSRELKRLDAVTRSPVYALFSSTLSGLMVIRSFRTEENFVATFMRKMDENTRCFIMFQTTARWFGFRLDAIAALVVLTLSLIIAGTRNSMNPSDAGFALSYCLLLTALFQWCVRQSAEVETMMTSVERIVEYGELPAEGALINEDYRPAAGWPATGRIEFRDYKMRYRAGLDLVLKGVDLAIQPGEKVGVCGRTGAGKSSLFQALLRLVEADSGGIYIDDMEIGRLGLSDLRTNLAIIPQYPVIFSGSLRYNLDPFDQCTDYQLWSALEAVQLKPMVAGLRDGIQTEMAEFGGNFSVGECQLVCVARALLKPSKILLVDEATANVDSHTDALIQTVIREKFADRTVLTIAHRLNTILDCQKIVVMSAGRVAESGSPAELLARPPADLAADPNATYGLFAFMANQKKQAH